MSKTIRLISFLKRFAAKNFVAFIVVAGVTVVLGTGIVMYLLFLLTPESAMVPIVIKPYTDGFFVLIPNAKSSASLASGIAYYFSWSLWLVQGSIIALFIVSIFIFDDLLLPLLLVYIIIMSSAPRINYIPSDFDKKTNTPMSDYLNRK